MKTPEEILDDMLEGCGNRKPCKVDRNAPLAKALRHFLKLRAEGKTMVPLEHIYENGLKQEFDGPSMTTVRRWVQREERKNG